MVMYNCCEENTGVQYTTHYTVKPLNSTKVSGAFGKLCRHLNSADLNISERQYIIHIYIYLVYSIDTAGSGQREPPRLVCLQWGGGGGVQLFS